MGKNGKGKKYNNDNILFEGKYANAQKWNGKGYNKMVIYNMK